MDEMPTTDATGRGSPLRDTSRLAKVASESKSKSEILKKLGLRAAGGNYKALHRAAEQAGITLPIYEHRPPAPEKIPDSLVFVENSTYKNREKIKRRLYAMGVEEKCAWCGIGPEWDGRPLTLTLEHKNGVWNDNRVENLEILCPNCHSQTETFAGRKRRLKSECSGCGQPVFGGICRSCGAIAARLDTRTKYPELEELEELVEVLGYREVGRRYGVSDNAVRKHLGVQRRLRLRRTTSGRTEASSIS